MLLREIAAALAKAVKAIVEHSQGNGAAVIETSPIDEPQPVAVAPEPDRS